MRPRLLLPHRFKLIGIIVLIPFLVLGIAFRFFDFGFEFLTIKPHKPDPIFNTQQNLTDELALTGIIIGLLFIAFSSEREEDEFINKIRLESLQWAVLLNYILLIIATWVIYDTAYFDVMIYNMLTILLLFIFRFHIILWRYQYSATHQKYQS